MKSDRVLIGAVILLAAGSGLLCAYCHGTTGLSLGYPLTGTSVHIDITTTGLAALLALPLIGGGRMLLFIALVAAIVSLFRGPEPMRNADLSMRRQEPFEE